MTMALCRARSRVRRELVGGGGRVRVEKTNECVGDPCNLVRQFLKMLHVYYLPITSTCYAKVDEVFVCERD